MSAGHHPTRGATVGVLLAACAVLHGCTGSLFQSKAVPPSVYMLSAHASPGQLNLPADLAVMRPRLRAGLDTDRIAVLYPDKRLDYFADARWSGPLDEVVQDLTVQAFAAGARLRNVSADGLGLRQPLLAGSSGRGFSSRASASSGGRPVDPRAFHGAAGSARATDKHSAATAGAGRISRPPPTIA